MNSSRRFLKVCLLAIAIGLTGCGGGDKDSGAVTPTKDVEPGPEAVFASAQAAMESNDVSAMLSLVTPESVDAIAFYGYLRSSSIVEGMIPDKRELIEPIRDVYSKAGIKTYAELPRGQDAVAAHLGEDAATFVCELAALLPEFEATIWREIDGKLIDDVEVNGDAATAGISWRRLRMLPSRHGGRRAVVATWSTRFQFQRIGGNWKMLIDPIGLKEPYRQRDRIANAAR